LSEFKFAPHPPEPTTAAPFLISGTAPLNPHVTPVPADIVTMAPFTVLDTVEIRRLSNSLAHEKAAAHTAMMMDKLGVGIHAIRVGDFCLYAGTLFYLPFTAGVAISW